MQRAWINQFAYKIKICWRRLKLETLHFNVVLCEFNYKFIYGNPEKKYFWFLSHAWYHSYFYFCLAKYFKQQTILFIFSQNDKAYLIELATKHPKFVWEWTIIRYLEKADVIHECSLFWIESVEATRWILITWPDWSLESWLLHMCSRRSG